MEIKETLIFNKIKMPNLTVEEVAEVFKTWKYTDELGIGFTYVHIEDDSIVTNVLYRIPSYVQNYNSQDNIFEKNIIYIYDEIQIVLDCPRGLIYSASSSVKFNKAKSLLRNCFKSKISFENIESSAVKMFERLRMLNWNPFIVDLSIKKFMYKEGAVGRLSLHFEKSEIGEELLDLYSSNINRMTVLVESKEFSNFILSIASQNSFTIKSKESDFWSIVNLIKQNL